MALRRLFSLLLLFGFSICLQNSFAQLAPRSDSDLLNPGNSRPTPLPQSEAFPYYVSEVSPGKLRVSWTPAAGHYLYRHGFSFSLLSVNSQQAIAIEYTLPRGLEKNDEFFGDIEAYYDQVSAELDLSSMTLAASTLIIEYQGCADWGFCYPPQKVEHIFPP